MKRFIALFLCLIIAVSFSDAAVAELSDLERAELDIRAELDDDPETYWETPMGAHDFYRVVKSADKLAEMLDKLASYAAEREKTRFDSSKTAEDEAKADTVFEERLKEMKDSYKDFLEEDLDDIAVPYVDADGKTVYIEIEDQYEILFDAEKYNAKSADLKGFAGEGGNSYFLKNLAEQARALKLTAARKALEAELDCAYRRSEKTKMDYNALQIGLAKASASEAATIAAANLGKAKEMAVQAQATAKILIQDALLVANNSAQTAVYNAQMAAYNELAAAYAEAVTNTWMATEAYMAGLRF